MSPSRSRREKLLLAARVIFFSAVLIGAALIEYRVRTALDDPSTHAPPAGAIAAPESTGEIEAAHREERSGFMTEASGTVTSLLPDDREGSRHQRFIVRLESGHTLLIAHNIDLAERVPLRRGDRVRFRGQYEANERGGVVHWTHHDPAGRHDEGWIEHHDQRYQ
jgi:hypothetical protein